MTFKKLTSQIKALSTLIGVDSRIIGCSLIGQPIHAFHVGSYCGNQIIITGAIHAREWITTLLVTELVKIYSADTELMKKGGIYFIPLCNPDGVKIALEYECLWKANVRGVDLNVNFDADWGNGSQNVLVPGSENYIGPYPNSEPEVQTLINFTQTIKPKATIAYHSKGELIYYVNTRDEDFANKIGETTGYKPEMPKSSTGGYSDWVSLNLGIPALTIEVGNDDYTHPISEYLLPEILAQNKNVPKALFEFLF